MSEKSIDLHLLQCFDALIVEGSVTLAADRLGMSQPGMSNALARLRQVLDDPILIRAVKGMVPTPRAAQLAPVVREAIDQLSTILSGPQAFDPAKSTAVIRIAGTDSTLLCSLEPIIEEVRRQAPGMRFEITPLLHKRLQEPLESGTIDVAVGVYTTVSPSLYQSALYQDRICCLVGNNGKYANEIMTDQRYMDADHAVAIASAGYRSSLEVLIEDFLAATGRERRISFSAPYAGVLAPIVARTDMVLTINAVAAHAYAAWLPLTIKPFPFEVPPIHFTMVWHERSRNNAALRWMREKFRVGMATSAARFGLLD